MKTLFKSGFIAVFLAALVFASVQLLKQDVSAQSVIAPAISTINPSSVAKEGGDIITVSGYDFSAETQLIIGGVPAATTFVNENTLTAVAPANRVGDRSIKAVTSQSLFAFIDKGIEYTETPLSLSAITPNQGPTTGTSPFSIIGSGLTVRQKEFSKVSMGFSHACGVYEGSAYCWGSNSNGQIGMSGNFTPAIEPVKVGGLLENETVIDISAGTNYTCAIIENGTAYCWGSSTTGALGTGNTTPVSQPTAVSTTAKFQSIYAGSNFTCAIRSDTQQVMCWGAGDNYRLGRGTSTVDSYVPVLASSLTGTITTIAMGINHACAIKSDGTLWCWGAGSGGQIGSGSSTISQNPSRVSGVLNGQVVTAVSAGNLTTCAIANQTAYCWGNHANGATGQNVSSGATNVPAAVYAAGALNGKKVHSITSGTNFSCATTTEGKAYCWGINSSRQLGDNTTSMRTVPTIVAGATNNTHFERVLSNANGNATIAYDYDGNGFGWGAVPASYAHTATGNTNSDSTMPTPIVYTPKTDSPSVAFDGITSSRTETSDGTELLGVTAAHPAGSTSVTVTRYDGASQTLTNGYEFIAAPTVTSVSPQVGAVAGGDTITITGNGFTDNSKVYIGKNEVTSITVVSAEIITVVTPANPLPGNYEISVTDGFNRSQIEKQSFTYLLPAPTLAGISPNSGPAAGSQQYELTGTGFANALNYTNAISTSPNHTCSLQGSSQIFCWGLNSSGQLGSGVTISGENTVPVAVNNEGLLAGKMFTQITTMTTSSCVLTTDSEVYCWGAGTSGQLGNGTSTNQNLPVAVDRSGALSGKTIRQISSGISHTCALTTDNGVYCWGNNGNGELGNSSAAAIQNTPVAANLAALNGQSIASLDVGGRHSCVVTDTGRAYCWGLNSTGQLGDGTINDSNAAKEVYAEGSLKGRFITQISAGSNHTCAVTEDALAFCWGSNGYGRLGTGNSLDQLVPAQVDTLSGSLAFASIDAGAATTCALTTNNIAYCWGYNNYGQLGTGNAITYYIPTPIVSNGALLNKSVRTIDTNSTHGCLTTTDGGAYCWGYGAYGKRGDGTASNATQPVKVISTETKKSLPIISFDGLVSPRESMVIIDSTKLNGVTPFSPYARQSDVKVTNFDGQQAAMDDAYEYLGAPTDLTITPNVALVDGGDSATISGTHITEGSTVFVNDQEVTSTFNNGALTLTIPSAVVPGRTSVKITDSLQQSAEVPNGITYQLKAPTITAISPESGPLSGGDVTISGQNFANQLNLASSVSLGSNHTCAIYANETAYCWGANNIGQLGNGAPATYIGAPTAVNTDGVLANKQIKTIGAGSVYTCALTYDSIVACWGQGTSGRIGNGGTANTSIPTAVNLSGVLTGKTITELSVGSAHACVLTSEGQAACWGAGSSGQLGNGSTAGTNSTPVLVDMSGALAGKAITHISAGDTHTCAVTDDSKVYCWGSNTNGKLGDQTTTQKNVPTLVDDTGALRNVRIASVSAGTHHTCAVDVNGLAYCWGTGSNWQLGNEATVAVASSPVAVTMSGNLSGKKIRSISPGAHSTCATASDNLVYCWGQNNLGQGGNGSTTGISTPTAVTSGAAQNKAMKSVAISSSGAVCAAAYDGSLICWGYGAQQQLGNSATDNQLIAIQASTNSDLAKPTVSFGGTAIAASALSFISNTELRVTVPSVASARTVDVAIQNFDRQTSTASNAYTYNSPLGTATISPVSGSIDGGDIVTINGSGLDESIKLLVRGEYTELTLISSTQAQFIAPAVFVPGHSEIALEDAFGQQTRITSGYTYMLPAPSIDSLTPSNGPIEGGQTATVNGTNLENVLDYGSGISAGSGFSCGVFASTKIYCWGNGRLGDGTSNSSPIPVAVVMDGVLANKSILQVSSGNNFACALASDLQVYCWGGNTYGQLGDGTTTNRNVPGAVSKSGALAGKNIRSISAGYTHACAITTDGKTYCWGQNQNGQLGDGTTTNRTTPIEVSASGALASKNTVSVSAGTYASCAVTSEGLAYCWGVNSNGRLGDGTTTERSTPTAVVANGALSGVSLTSISTDNANTCAVSSDQNVYCWGYGALGTVGNGSTTTQLSPVVVSTNSGLSAGTVKSVSVGTYIACAISTDAKVYCWGQNTYGGVGDGTNTNRSTPTAVVMPAAFQDKNIVQVDVGSTYFACAMTSEGNTLCWGYNNFGQLGNNTTTDTNTPIGIVKHLSDAGLRLTLGSASAVNATYISPTQAQITTPAHGAGTVDATVTNFQGQQATRSSAYTYAAPASVESIAPSQGLVSGGDIVTVNGSGFTGAMKAFVDGQEVAATIINETTLQFTTPTSATPGVKTVVIEDSYGQQSTVSGGFTYMLPAPIVTSIEPNKSRASTLTNVTIRGSGFVTGGNYYTVSFGGSAGTQVNVVDENTLTVRTPSRAAGSVDVTIGGTYVTPATVEGGYTFTPSSYSFTNTRLTIDTNQQGMLTVTAGGNATTNVDTVVSLSSSSSTSEFATDLSENEATRWAKESVVIPAGASSVNVWFRDSVSGNHIVTGNAEGLFEFTQTQIVSSPYRFIVAGVSDPIKSGVPSSVTVRVVDRNNVQRTDYTGTINFTSTDPLARLPASYTFKPADYGIKTFTNGVSFRTAGERCVRVADSVDAGMNGQQCNITVQQADTGSISRLRVITPEQTIASGRYSAPISIQTQDNTGLAIPVDADTSLYIYGDSETGEFSTDGETWFSDQPFELTATEGSSTTNFFYRDTTAGVSRLTIRDQATTGGADNGWSDTYQDITTGASPPTQLAVSGPTALKNGIKGTYTISLQDDAGNSVTADSDVTVRVDSSTTTGLFYRPLESTTGQQGPVEFVIPSGYSSTTIGYSDSAITTNTPVTLTFADGRPETETIRLRDGTATVQIVDEFASQLAINAPANAAAGAWTAVTLSLTDEEGQAAIAENATAITLGTSSASGQFSLTENGTTATSVTIPAGQNSTVVYYRDTVATSATLEASASNFAAVQHQLTTTALTPASIVINPTTITAEYDTPTMATISTYDIYGNVSPTSEALTVYLHKNADSTSFSADGETWNAGSIVIPEGSSTGVFYVRDNSFDDIEKEITATTNADVETPDTNIARSSAPLVVISQSVETIQFTNDTQSITAGEVTQRMQVELLKEDGSPALQDGTSNVAINSTSGEILANASDTEPISAITVARGAYRAAFYYTATEAGEQQVTASRSGTASASQPVEVSPAAPFAVHAAANKTELQVDEASTLTVQLRDEFGNDTTTETERSVQLSASCANGSFSADAESWESIESAAISAGSGSRTLYFRSSLPGSCVLTLSSAGLQEATINTHIASDAAASIEFTTQPRTVVAGEASEVINVQLNQESGEPAYQDGSTSITLKATRGQLSLDNSTFGDAETFAIPAGSASVNVYYKGEVAGTQAINASIEDTELTAQQSVVVTAAQASQLTFTTEPQDVAAGAPSGVIEVAITDAFENETTLENTATVTLSTSCEDGRFSLNSAEWEDTITVTIPAYTSTAQFFFRSYTVERCDIQAVTPNLAEATQSINVFDDSYPYSLQINTSSDVLAKGAPRTVTVTLLDQYGDIVTANTNTYIGLSTNETGGSFTSPQLRFNPGQSTVSTNYTAAQAGTWALTATHAELGTDTIDVTYVDGDATQLLFTQNETAIAGEYTSLRVSAANEYGLAVAHTQPISVALTTSSTGAFFTEASANPPISTIEIPAGEESVELYYRQTEAGNATLTAQNETFGEATLPLGIRSAAIHEMRFLNQPYTGDNAITYGGGANYQVQLYDVYGNAATTDADIRLNVNVTYGTQNRTGTVLIEAGSSIGGYRLELRQVTPFTIAVSDQNTEDGRALESITQEGEVINGAVTSFRFEPSETEMVRGSVTPIKIVFVNENGEPTTLSQNRTVTLTIPQGTGELSRSSAFTTTIGGVTVPAGQSSTTVYYRNNNGAVAPFTHQLQGQVSLNGETITQTSAIQMTYGTPEQLVITTPQRSHQQNTPSAIITVEQRNQYGSAVPAEADTTLHLRSSSPTGQFGADKTTWPVSEVTLRAGSANASFYYNDATMGSHQLTVSDVLPVTPDTGLRNARQNITTTEQVVVRTVDNFLVTNISDPQAAGTPSTVIVIARDADGFVIPTYRGTISFASDDPAAILPGNYTFTARDAGVAIFNNRVAFAQTGLKTVSVTDQDGNAGQQTDITVIDGTAEPIAAIAITHPSALEVAPNTASQNITFELRDVGGNFTTSGLEGLTVRLSSSTQTGEFATSPTGPWSSTLDYEVQPGLGFGNFYYRDSQVGEGTILVTDWVNEANSSAIADATLTFAVNSIRIEHETNTQSRNVFGTYEPSAWLFSSTPTGAVYGTSQNTFSAYRMSDGMLANVEWRSEWRKGVSLISSGSQSGQNSISVNVNNVVAQAGDTSFYANAQATDTNFSDLYNVVSREVEVPVSPWTSELTLNTVNTSAITATAAFTQNRAQASPYMYGYYLVAADATSVNNALASGGALSPEAATAFTLDVSSLDANGSYRLVSMTYDESGNITSQAATEPFALQTIIEPETPGVTTPTAPSNSGTSLPVAETPNNGDVTTEPSVTPVSPEPTEEQEATETVAAESTSIAPFVTLYSVATGGIVLLLLRESWREVALARFARRLINGDQLSALVQKVHSLARISKSVPATTADAAQEIAAALPAGKDEQLLEGLAKPASHSFFFWLPIALSALITGAMWIVLSQASAGAVSDGTGVYISVVVTAVSLAAFFITRSIITDRERTTAQTVVAQYRPAIEEARQVETARITHALGSERTPRT